MHRKKKKDPTLQHARSMKLAMAVREGHEQLKTMKPFNFGLQSGPAMMGSSFHRVKVVILSKLMLGRG